MLDQRVDVTCGSKVFDTCEFFTDELNRLNGPIPLFPPGAFGHHGNEKLIYLVIFFGLELKYFQEFETQLSHLFGLELPVSNIMRVEQTLIEQIHEESLLALGKDIFDPINFKELINTVKVP